MQEPKAKGKKLERYHWLTLPLCPECHAALDADVEAWEAANMPQADIIDRLAVRFGLPLWHLAAPTKPTLPQRIAA